MSRRHLSRQKSRKRWSDVEHPPALATPQRRRAEGATNELALGKQRWVAARQPKPAGAGPGGPLARRSTSRTTTHRNTRRAHVSQDLQPAPVRLEQTAPRLTGPRRAQRQRELRPIRFLSSSTRQGGLTSRRDLLPDDFVCATGLLQQPSCDDQPRGPCSWPRPPCSLSRDSCSA